MRILTLAIVTGAIATAAIAQDSRPDTSHNWPQWLGPDRNGVTPEVVKPWKSGLKELWRAQVGEGHSSPVVSGNRVFLHSKVAGKDEEQLTIFDAITGKEIGTSVQPRKPFSSVFGLGPRATPIATTDGTVITFGVTGILNVQGPASNWRKETLEQHGALNLRFGVSASPIVVGDNVIVAVGGKGASLAAYKRANGQVAWKSLDDPASYASPIIIDHGGKKLLVTLTANGVVAVQPNDGQLAWRFPFKDLLAESSTTPVQVGDRLIASSITLGSVALRLTTKDGKPSVEKDWENKSLSCYFSTPAVVGEHLYMVTGGLLLPPAVNLHCVETATGNILWTQRKVGKYHAALLRTGDNKLLMHSDSGDLIMIDPNPREYHELARSQVCGETWAHPAIADGRIYVRDARELICVQFEK
jgi:outer membrane protein assembly factor BamB